MKPSYLITNDSVVVMKGGKRLYASVSHSSFARIIELIKENRFNNIERLFNHKETLEKYYNITIKNSNIIFYKGKVVSNPVAQIILDFMRSGRPYKPLVKFLDKLMENPSEESRESLYDYLSLHKLPITEDGCFIACKAVDVNFMDHHSGKIHNKIGADIFMDRKLVSKDRNECAGAGLHVGSYQYVSTYGQGKSKYVMVKVHPRDVVVVPNEGGYGKIRLCRYKVISEISLSDLNFSSHYAPEIPKYKELRRNSKGQFCKA